MKDNTGKKGGTSGIDGEIQKVLDSLDDIVVKSATGVKSEKNIQESKAEQALAGFGAELSEMTKSVQALQKSLQQMQDGVKSLERKIKLSESMRGGDPEKILNDMNLKRRAIQDDIFEKMRKNEEYSDLMNSLEDVEQDIQLVREYLPR